MTPRQRQYLVIVIAAIIAIGLLVTWAIVANSDDDNTPTPRPTPEVTVGPVVPSSTHPADVTVGPVIPPTTHSPTNTR
jgi:hypothetical protein